MCASSRYWNTSKTVFQLKVDDSMGSTSRVGTQPLPTGLVSYPGTPADIHLTSKYFNASDELLHTSS